MPDTAARLPKDGTYHLGVEIIETMSHSKLLSNLWQNCVLPPDLTRSKICARMKGSTGDDEDEFSIQQQGLSVDLADPFSAQVFHIPARGVSCTHIECFDLENWLNTRPSKPKTSCSHRVQPCVCNEHVEPSTPDHWKCPICHGDARPGSLRIDGFLMEIRDSPTLDGFTYQVVGCRGL